MQGGGQGSDSGEKGYSKYESCRLPRRRTQCRLCFSHAACPQPVPSTWATARARDGAGVTASDTDSGWVFGRESCGRNEDVARPGQPANAIPCARNPPGTLETTWKAKPQFKRSREGNIAAWPGRPYTLGVRPKEAKVGVSVRLTGAHRLGSLLLARGVCLRHSGQCLEALSIQIVLRSG